MGAVVGSALKKIAVSLLTNPKVLKKIVYIILIIIVIIIMPIIATVSIFNGDIKIDTDRLQQMVIENLSAEEKTKLQNIENTMLSIEKEMIKKGFNVRVKEAQILYMLALYEKSNTQDFVSKLVSCFEKDQTDEQLINKVNQVFNINILLEEFQKIMGSIRETDIDDSNYTDPTTKNNLDLVQWAINAHKSNWGYVWGTYGDILDEKMFEYKVNQYPNDVGIYKDFIKQNWLNGRTADCVGLIKGYGWYDTTTKQIKIGLNGMPDIGANAMFNNAVEKGSIDTIPDIPGLAVWHDGHIGVYIGNGEVIQEANTLDGIMRGSINSTRWTHWLKIPYIKYVDKKQEEKDK